MIRSELNRGIFSRRGLNFVLGAVWASILLTVNSVSAQQVQKQPDPTHELFTFFYTDPRPERLVGFFERYENPPESRNWEAYPPVAGFFAVIFRKHPEQVERLTPARFNAKSAETIAAALQLSGSRPIIAKFLPRLKEAGRDDKLAAEFSGLPSRLEDLHIRTATHLDILWGASFASGDAHFVRMIMEFFAQIANRSELVAIDVAKTAVGMMGGPKVTDLRSKYDDTTARQIVYAAVALWGLQSNERQHVFVEQVVTTYIQDHRGTPAAKALSALSPKSKRT